MSEHVQSTLLITDTLGPSALSVIEGVSVIRGVVKCIVIINGTNSSVHYRECPLLGVSVKRELTVVGLTFLPLY